MNAKSEGGHQKVAGKKERGSAIDGYNCRFCLISDILVMLIQYFVII